MTKRDLLEIVLKVFGLYLLTLAIDSLILVVKSSTFFFKTNAPETNEDLVYFVANTFRMVFYVFGFWLLIFKTSLLKEKLIKDNPENISLFNIEKSDLLQILFCASGIIISIISISDVWLAITMLNLREYDGIPENARLIIFTMQLGIPTTKLLVGLSLIFASTRLAKFLTKKKNNYTNINDQQTPETNNINLSSLIKK